MTCLGSLDARGHYCGQPVDGYMKLTNDVAAT